MRRLLELASELALLQAGEAIVIHSGAAHPGVLAGALAASAQALHGRRVHSLLPLGLVPYAQEPARSALRIATCLPGTGLRAAMDAGHVEPLRLPLSAMPALLTQPGASVGAALVRVSPPDASGRVSLGVSVDYMLAAVKAARVVVAEIDPAMPRVAGESSFDAERIDAYVDAQDGPHEAKGVQPDAVEEAIASHVASIVEDGAVLQLGAGALPDLVMAKLAGHRHLGLHTGIVGDSARTLIENGVVDNSTKRVFPGVSTATMALGSRAFYDWLDGNPAIEFHPCDVTHRAETLRQLDTLCAINSALQVSLDGEVNAEWAGTRRVSTRGGLTDFARAAASLPAGRSIVAFRAVDRNGGSNILRSFPAGRPASLQPGEVDFYITEFGVAAVRGLSPHQRRRAIAAVAHPQHRDGLAMA